MMSRIEQLRNGSNGSDLAVLQRNTHRNGGERVDGCRVEVTLLILRVYDEHERRIS